MLRDVVGDVIVSC